MSIKSKSIWQRPIIWVIVGVSFFGWAWYHSPSQKLPAPNVASSIDYDRGRKLIPPLTSSVSAAFPQARIWVEDDYSLRHSNILYDNGRHKQWVVIHNGEDISYHPINDKSPTFKHDKAEQSGVYSVYLEQQVDGVFRIISNVASYNITIENKESQSASVSELSE